MNTIRTVAAAALLTLGAIQGAFAESRMALVIGNSSYRSVTALPNPANDAKAVTEMLNTAGFDVTSAPDLTQSDMRRTVRDFTARVTQKGPETVALIYYAGHGVQVDGENYLVPVDATIQSESDVAIEAVRLADVMNALAATPSRTRIVILDACRNNPFSAINKTTGRGLAIVDAPTGSIVSYSTSPGAEALDGEGGNSPFTAALVDVAREPGVPIEQAFKRVRLAVHDKTQGQQTPWESSSLTENFSFFGTLPQAKTESSKSQSDTKQAAASADPGASRSGAPGVQRKPPSYWRDQLLSKSAADAFTIVIREDDVDAYEQFLLLYPVPPYAERVRALLDRRREMMTWYTVITVNTVIAYEAFLKRYPNSDLAATAQRLLEHAKFAGASASFMPNLPGLGAQASAPVTPPATLVSATAMCPCQKDKDDKPERKADTPKSGKPTKVRQVSGPDDDGPPPSIRVIGTPRPHFTPRPSYPMRGQNYPSRTQGFKRY